ncbi:P-loop containing nucleoside triphosphate hydrolase protein [Lasiosphaeris hirsuta]|uniref:P-loop containing nucleoside triphosphate hydrolase protein n=1 Tax=Lasiosphaeris hirsuta TaxID=260670 RepID=A0AA40B1B4_9PEZI|nr:P-loop containing nucleoside triphosphate hydrolase protein [Lasiosphaeris hirsuta]
MLRRRFFTRNFRSKLDSEHIGRTANIQTFYEAPNSSDKNDTKWVDYAPPSLPQAKREKLEGAAVQVYKRRDENSNVRRDGFQIQKVLIQSPYLRNALRDTLERYGIVYDRQDIFAESIAPHHGLFFALDRVAELAKTADDEVTRNHCGLLCSVIEEIFGDTVDKLEQLEEQGKITFDLLWTLFPQQSVFATQADSTPPLAYRVKSVTQDKNRLKMVHESILFDGFRYGTHTGVTRIYAFDGAVHTFSIPDLPYIDLNRDDKLRARLLERGKKALEMQAIRYMVEKPETNVADEFTSPWLRGQNHQRVIIDPHLYRLRKAQFILKPLPGYNIGDEDSNKPDPTEPEMNGMGDTEMDRNRRVVLESEDNLLILYHQVAGYSVDKRTWEMLYVENLHPFQGDRTVFDKVVLEEAKKDILMTLIEGHKELTAKYDDLIAGKGQYLLVILSGPPGTGKTLMAESLAEHLGCPLLRADPTQSASSDDRQDLLGKRVGSRGPLAPLPTTAVLIFQNSAFLRQAEYFKGIIFLTTNLNRGSIDPAVLSRAQIHITFPSLTAPLRARVWKNFVDRLPEDVGTLDDAAVARLSVWHVNGREIKNILNMSVSWCRRKNCTLSVEYIETLIGTICPSAKKEHAANGEAGNEEGGLGGRTTSNSVKSDLLLLDMP